jgi:phage-related baseplate assembly protein
MGKKLSYKELLSQAGSNGARSAVAFGVHHAILDVAVINEVANIAASSAKTMG